MATNTAQPERLTHEELAEANDLLAAVRNFLLECDSNLSAYGHGRELTKEDALRLSDQCRSLWKRLGGR